MVAAEVHEFIDAAGSRPVDFPDCAVFRASGLEKQLGAALGTSRAQNLTRRRHSGILKTAVSLRGPLSLQTRGDAEQRQRDAVKDSGFARADTTRDEEHLGGSQWLGVEIYGCIGKRRYIMQRDGMYLHKLSLSLVGSRTLSTPSLKSRSCSSVSSRPVRRQ